MEQAESFQPTRKQRCSTISAIPLMLMTIPVALQAHMAAFLSYDDHGKLARSSAHFYRVTLISTASPAILDIGWWQSTVVPPVLLRSRSKTVVLDCSLTEFRAPMTKVWDALVHNPRLQTLILRSWMLKELPAIPMFSFATLTCLTVLGPIYDNGEIITQIAHIAPQVQKLVAPGLGWKLVASEVMSELTGSLPGDKKLDVQLPIPNDFNWRYQIGMHPLENDKRGPGTQPGKGLDAGICSLCHEQIGKADILAWCGCNDHQRTNSGDSRIGWIHANCLQEDICDYDTTSKSWFHQIRPCDECGTALCKSDTLCFCDCEMVCCFACMDWLGLELGGSGCHHCTPTEYPVKFQPIKQDEKEEEIQDIEEGKDAREHINTRKFRLLRMKQRVDAIKKHRHYRFSQELAAMNP